MTKLTTLRFPIVSLRRIDNSQKDSKAKDYVAVASIEKLPEELNEWRDINVRDEVEFERGQGYTRDIGKRTRYLLPKESRDNDCRGKGELR